MFDLISDLIIFIFFLFWVGFTFLGIASAVVLYISWKRDKQNY